MQQATIEGREAVNNIKISYNKFSREGPIDKIVYKHLEGFVKCNDKWLQVHCFHKDAVKDNEEITVPMFLVMTAFLLIKDEEGFIESIIFYAVDASLFYIYEDASRTISIYMDPNNIAFGPRVDVTCDSIEDWEWNMVGSTYNERSGYTGLTIAKDDKIVHGPNTMMNVADYVIEKRERGDHKMLELGTMFYLFMLTPQPQEFNKGIDGQKTDVWIMEQMTRLYDNLYLKEQKKLAAAQRHLYPTGSHNAEPSSSRLNTALAAAVYVAARVVLAPIAIPLAPLLLARGGKESNESKGSKECKRYILYNRRRYVVLKEDRKSYIVSKKRVVYLSEIRGKYEKWGMLAACGGSPPTRSPPTAPIAGKSKDA